MRGNVSIRNIFLLSFLSHTQAGLISQTAHNQVGFVLRLCITVKLQNEDCLFLNIWRPLAVLKKYTYRKQFCMLFIVRFELEFSLIYRKSLIPDFQ